MNKLDTIYYQLKELNDYLYFYQNKADNKVRGAKVKVRTIKSKISNLREKFQDEQYKHNKALETTRQIEKNFADAENGIGSNVTWSTWGQQ